MKLLLAAALVLTPVNEAETILLPKESAEMLVKDNLRLQGEVEALREAYEAMRQHRNKLQSSTNCA